MNRKITPAAGAHFGTITTAHHSQDLALESDVTQLLRIEVTHGSAVLQLIINWSLMCRLSRLNAFMRYHVPSVLR